MKVYETIRFLSWVYKGKQSVDRISVDQNCVLSVDRNCGNQLIEFHSTESVDRKF